jgi:hypothetical protein
MRFEFMYLVPLSMSAADLLLAWDISNIMEAAWVVRTLQKAVSAHGKTEIINS